MHNVWVYKVLNLDWCTTTWSTYQVQPSTVCVSSWTIWTLRAAVLYKNPRLKLEPEEPRSQNFLQQGLIEKQWAQTLAI